MEDDLYWRYDESARYWVQTNRHLLVDTRYVLYTRAINVTSCPNLFEPASVSVPSTPTKRRAPPDVAFDRSPRPAKLSRISSSSSVGDIISRSVHFTPLLDLRRSHLLHRPPVTFSPNSALTSGFSAMYVFHGLSILWLTATYTGIFSAFPIAPRLTAHLVEPVFTLSRPRLYRLCISTPQR